ncbi:Protein saf4 [Coemansia sp. RSA 551]|nr:Protein saf4 [Coemansia sp. RSA 551]
MAERRATNKYYPPDWDPSQGSVNAYIGQHPLRDRARKLNEGILIVRFELPFSIWCGGCNSLLSTGLRFNAEKKKIGSYYTTPVWSFRLKCRECGHWFEIHTNPKDSAYEVVSGARKKAMPEMSNEDDGTAGEIVDLSRVEDRDNKNSLLHKLEALDARKQRDKRTMERLSTLQTASDNQWKDSDKTNAHLRRVFR